MAGDYPNESMYLLQHLFNNWFLNMSLDKMAAASVVSAGAIFILVLLLKKAWSVQQLRREKMEKRTQKKTVNRFGRKLFRIFTQVRQDWLLRHPPWLWYRLSWRSF